jgi:SOUL heme-binding protein
MNIVYIILGMGILWSVWGYFASNVEQSAYTVIESRDGYEIRLYPEHIVAETTVTGPYKEALNQGFRIVAGYIFGANTKSERIAMTAPVTQAESSTESIAMTAPVLATVDGESHTIAFGMPRSHTLESLPTPTDSRVRIRTVPEKKVAVLRFSLGRSTARVQAKKLQLIELLKRDAVTTVGEPQFAGYNGPWTPPWMIRNEVMIEVMQ